MNTVAEPSHLGGSCFSAQGRRHANEDAYALAAHAGGWYAVVADGMGGGIDGSRFSMLAVQALSLTLTSRPIMDRQALEYALIATIDAVHSLRRMNAEYHSSGTTLVCATVLPHAGGASVSLANVGDSRAYLVTGSGAAQQLTLDHTYSEHLMAEGLPRQQAEQHPQAAHLTHVLGDGITIDQIPQCFSDLQLMHNEYLILCSDGVAKALTRQHLADIVRGVDSNHAAEALVQAALAAGSTDNATAIVIKVTAPGGSPLQQTTSVPVVRAPVRAAQARTAAPHAARHALPFLVLAVCAALAGIALLWYALSVAAVPSGSSLIWPAHAALQQPFPVHVSGAV